MQQSHEEAASSYPSVCALHSF